MLLAILASRPTPAAPISRRRPFWSPLALSQDPLFEHSVILMVPSTEPPLLAGLIINSPAKRQVRDMFPQARG